MSPEKRAVVTSNRSNATPRKSQRPVDHSLCLTRVAPPNPGGRLRPIPGQRQERTICIGIRVPAGTLSGTLRKPRTVRPSRLCYRLLSLTCLLVEFDSYSVLRAAGRTLRRGGDRLSSVALRTVEHRTFAIRLEVVLCDYRRVFRTSVKGAVNTLFKRFSLGHGQLCRAPSKLQLEQRYTCVMIPLSLWRVPPSQRGHWRSAFGNSVTSPVKNTSDLIRSVIVVMS